MTYINEIIYRIMGETKNGNNDGILNLFDELFLLEDKLLDQGAENQNLSILDIYPFQIKNHHKFTQVELAYSIIEHAHNSDKEKLFENYMAKFKSFFRLLWLKSEEFYVCLLNDEVEESLNQNNYPNLDVQWSKIKKHYNKGQNIYLINHADFLESLVSIAVMELISVYFIIPEMNLLFMSNGLNFIIYDLDNNNWMEKIANVEGLYIRK